jgi:carboxypeptidase C (cathepsin A)
MAEENDKKKENDKEKAEKEAPKEPPEDKTSVTKHSIKIGSRSLSYTATAGTLTLRDEKDVPKATMFYVAFTKNGVSNLGNRPVSFIFNGGPGSAALWLNLGMLGPRRVVIGDATVPLKPPYQLEDNVHTLLDESDLVFIDPVSTGYSRPLPDEDKKQFHGVKEDAQWVAEFIRLWTTRNLRWGSPKFLIGESYGTVRAGALSGVLQDRHGIFLNGIVLISAVLNLASIAWDPANDVLPYILILPTYAATAMYHGRLDSTFSSLEELTQEVEEFALGEFATALHKGRRLDDKERRIIAERVAYYTGLSPEFVERCNLRVRGGRFQKELLRDERRTVGRLDSRFTGIDADAAGEQIEYDPLMPMISGIFTASMNNYLRSELQFETDLVYEPITGAVSPWNYGELGNNRYVDVGHVLRSAMSKNRDMRLMVQSGYYDLGTPYFGSEYTIDHMGLDPSLDDNVTTTRYESGHMMYIHEPSIAQARADIGTFLSEAIGDSAKRKPAAKPTASKSRSKSAKSKR